MVSSRKITRKKKKLIEKGPIALKIKMHLYFIPDEEKSDKTSWWHKVMVSLRFGMTFINSVMVTMTRWLNKLSRDYRYVIRILTMEKKILKVCIIRIFDCANI